MNAEPVAGGTLSVDVAWSPSPREVLRMTLALPRGATIATALRETGWAGLDAAAQGEEAWAAAGLSTAVWGQSRALDHALREGDRVEVLRALVIAPMDARRVRFTAAGGVKALRKRGASGPKD